MKILIVAASPKKRFSTSIYYAKFLELTLKGHDVELVKLKTVVDYNLILKKLPELDALILSFPVYVDAIPSTVLEYLCKFTEDIGDQHYKMKVYGLNGCGFYQGSQCNLTLNMLKNWCVRTNLEWGAGLGIGASEMLSIIRINVPVGLIITFIEIIIHAFAHQGNFVGFFPTTLIIQTIVYILFSLGMFVGLVRLRQRITHRLTTPNFFTTVWFCPQFLFVFFASIYWVVRAFVCHRVLPWRLFNKEKERIGSSSKSETS